MSSGPGFDEFLPGGNVRRELAGRILFLERFQLPFQLPQSERQAQLLRDEECLDKKDGRNKDRDPAKKERKPEARPAAAGRIGENKRSAFVGKISVHQAGGERVILPVNARNASGRQEVQSEMGDAGVDGVKE